MSNHLFHAVVDDALKEEVMASRALPLVRELNHLYGLKVYSKSTDFCYGSYGSSEPNNGNFMLCDAEEGLPVARVFIYENNYCYHTPYQAKQRGVDDFDRHTFRSQKLSSLMATIRKAKLITTGAQVMQYLDTRICQPVNQIYTHYGVDDKLRMNGDAAHELLLAIKSGKTLDDLPQSSRDLYLKALDQYSKVDLQLEARKQGTIEMMKDCYIVGADKGGQYVIADATYETLTNNKVDVFKPKLKTPFKRVKSLEEYPHILSILTMLKVHLDKDYEPWSPKSLAPHGDEFIPDLGVSYGYMSKGSDFNMVWLCISK
jgi:hypothetical protein